MQGLEPKEQHRPETRVQKLFQNMHADGWTCDRITGSHHIFRKQGRRPIPISVHGGHIPPGMARLVLRQTNLQQNQRAVVVERPKAMVEAQTTHRAKSRWSESGKERGHEVNANVDDSRPDSEPTAGSIDHDNSRQSASKVAQEPGDLDDSAQRTSWLETVHEWIGSGEYEQLLAFLETPTGLPSKLFNNFTWTSDLFFYRMFALCELALGSLSSINAPEHHQRIETAFLSCTTMIERFPDRRVESREYVRGIQARVFDQYCVFLTSQVFAQHELKYGVGCVEKRLRGQELRAEQSLTTAQVQQGYEGQSLIAAGFIFIMELKGSVPLPLEEGAVSSFMPCITIVSERMLVCFDNGWYPEAEKLARLSIVFHKENQAALEFFSMASDLLLPQTKALCTPTQLALITSQFVLHLLPAQRYAEEHFEHFRHASYFHGFRRDFESIDAARQGKLCQSEKLASYMAHLFHAFHTVRCNPCEFHSFINRFTVDSLLDPLFLIKSRFEHLLSTDHHLRHVNDDFMRFAVKRSKSGQDASPTKYVNIKASVLARQFKQVKYRSVVKELSRTLVWLVSLRELFAMTTLEAKVGAQDALRISRSAQAMFQGYVTSQRLYELPKLFYNVFQLLELVSGEPTPCTSRFSSTLFFQIGVLQLDLEAQANWDVCGYKGGRCWGWQAGEEKRQSVQALSFVSFNAVLQDSIPIVVVCSMTEKERKQTHVLHRMRGSSVEDFMGMEAVSDTTLETSLWQIFLSLLWLTKSSKEVAKDEVCSMVEILSLDEDRIHDHLSRPGEATQLQSVSVRSCKLIKRLQDAVAPHAAELEEARAESVGQLLAFYKESVLAARHMPKMEREIQGNEEGLRKAGRSVKSWTVGEAAALRGALTRFGKATEKLSRVISAAFGGNLRVIHTIDSPEFELNHWQTRDQPPATTRALNDLRIVRGVLAKKRAMADSAVAGPQRLGH